ncbi:unnamed protein product [Alopecurus aequalis]
MSASSSSMAAASGAERAEAGIDDLLQHLDLRDDELDDVVIGADEVRVLEKDARWLAVAKVHTTRSFSADALFGKMKAIWNLSREPNCREAGNNLFIFQMHCLGDWKKVVHQGPWTFRGWAVLIEDYDGRVEPEKVEFGGIYVWAQIHGIPELYRKVSVIDDLARRIGKTKEVQMNPKLFFEGNYVRIRVLIEVDKALKRVTGLNVEGEGTKRLFVKYEKIPYFCKRCGLIGHNHEECGDGVWSARELQYGDFMLATRREVPPPLEARAFIPRGRGGRTGFRTEPNPSRKRSSQDASLDSEADLMDDATSPLKAPSDIAVDSEPEVVAKRNLDFSSEKMNTDSVTANPEVPAAVPPPPPGYINPRDRTKQQKTFRSTNDLATSAASTKGDRRAQ